MPLTIVGLGPGSIDDLSLKAWRTLQQAQQIYLRTKRHPCVDDLPDHAIIHSFDDRYDSAETFTDVYVEIVEELLSAAQKGAVVYAVPGDPLVGEATTQLLLDAAHTQQIDIQIVHGISFIEPMLAQVGIDALDGLQIIDGLTVATMHHPPLNPALPAFIAQVYSRSVASDVKLTLMNQYPDDTEVVLIHGASTADAVAARMPLYEIDRDDRINHLTSLYVPALGPYSSYEALQEVIAHLRAPEGCPWDRKQTHESLRPYLIEEAYEVLDAIDEGNYPALAGELGDVLLQVVLHTQIATEAGDFQMSDVLDHINRKMIRRHPHVWGPTEVNGDAEQVVVNWEAIKKAERAAKGEVRESLLDGVPKGLPALSVAHKYQHKAAKVGFDWPDISGVEDKMREELEEIIEEDDPDRKRSEIGDLLFVLVNYLRWLGEHDPEATLRATNAKFYRRFRYIEAHAGRPLEDLTLDDMDTLWNEAKRAERADL